MTITNHTVTGATVAAIIANPYFAIPAALISHLVLDAIPHFDWFAKKGGVASRKFNLLLLIDAAAASAFLLNIFILQLNNWPLLVMCGIVAASPDLLSLPAWINGLTGKPSPELGPIRGFLKKIQWAEIPQGWIVEALWFIAVFTLFLNQTVNL